MFVFLILFISINSMLMNSKSLNEVSVVLMGISSSEWGHGISVEVFKASTLQRPHSLENDPGKCNLQI